MGKRAVVALMICVGLVSAVTVGLRLWASGSATAAATSAPSAGISLEPPSPLPAPSPGRPYVTVALGDSVPSGAGCEGCTSYPELVGQGLGAHFAVAQHTLNLSISAHQASQLMAQLQQPDVAADLRAAQLVLLTDGANDLDFSLLDRADCAQTMSTCDATTIETVRTSLVAALTRIRALNPTVTVVLTGYWNVTVDGLVAQQDQTPLERQNAGTLTLDFNAMVQAVAEQTGARYVDLWSPFARRSTSTVTDLLVGDGDHLSQQGHQLAARVILKELIGTD